MFSLADEESFRLVTDYSRRFSHLRPNLPLFLIGTQDALGARSPRVIDDSRARKLAHDLNGEYIETCATYGMNVDKVGCPQHRSRHSQSSFFVDFRRLTP